MLLLSRPAVYTLELTSACNQRCPACSNGVDIERRHPPLEAAVWESWLQEFGPEAVRLRLSGGEPTLHPQFARILASACSYPAWVSVFTNARWHNPTQILNSLKAAPHLAGLLVSLHGAAPASHAAFTGSLEYFDQVIGNVRRAVDEGIQVALSMVLTRHNVHEIDAYVQLGESLGVQHLAFTRLIGPPQPGLDPSRAQLLRAVRRIQELITAGAPVRYGTSLPQCFASNASDGCLAGVVSVAIGPWGGVRPCLYSPTEVGSLLEGDLQTIWLGERMQAWRALPAAACSACAALEVCHGGCRAMHELRQPAGDPLQGKPRKRMRTPVQVLELPAQARPQPAFRLRAEAFGYVLLGESQAVPVSPDALPVLEACDGRTSFAELTQRLGEDEINFLAELWHVRLLEEL